MPTGLIILLLTVVAIVVTDLKGYNKLWPTGIGVLVLLIYAPQNIGHGLHEALPMTGFLVGVMLLANYIQEAGGLSKMNAFIKGKWTLALFIFVVSMFFDNTVATTLGIGIVTVLTGRGRFAAFVAFIALLGGLWTPIGDVTSTMTWIGGKMSTMGLIAIGPAAILGAILYTFMTNKMTFKANAPQAVNTSNAWVKLGIGMILFLTIPLLKQTHLHIGEVDVSQPGVIAPIMTFVGFIIMKYGFKSEIGVRPHDKDEEKAIIKTAAYIFMILMCVGLLHSDLEAIKGSVALMSITAIILISLVASSHVDNVPWTAILIATLPYAQDSIEWQLLVVVLGLAGGLSPVGSTSTLVASSLLSTDEEKVGFKQFYREGPKMLLTILVVAAFVYLQYLVLG